MLNKSWIRWAAAAYAIALAYLLLAPRPLFFLGGTGTKIDDTISASVSDWIEHGCAYAILAGLFCAAFGEKRFVAAFLATLLHGLTTESLQHFIPLRESSWADAAANTGGVMIVAVAVLALRRSRHRQPAAFRSPHAPFHPAMNKSLRTAGDPAGE